MTPTTYITPEQAADLLPAGHGNGDWVRAQLRRGKLQGYKVGGRWLTTREHVDEMVTAGSNVERKRRRRAA